MKTFVSIFCLLLLLTKSNAIPTIKSRAPTEPLSRIVGIEENHQFIDEFGRQRFFRGLNVVSYYVIKIC